MLSKGRVDGIKIDKGSSKKKKGKKDEKEMSRCGQCMAKVSSSFAETPPHHHHNKPIPNLRTPSPVLAYMILLSNSLRSLTQGFNFTLFFVNLSSV